MFLSCMVDIYGKTNHKKATGTPARPRVANNLSAMPVRAHRPTERAPLSGVWVRVRRIFVGMAGHKKEMVANNIVIWCYAIFPAFFVFHKVFDDWGAIIRFEQTPFELFWVAQYLLLLLLWFRWLYFLKERPQLAVSKSGITYRGILGGTFFFKQVHTIAWDNVSCVKQGALLYTDGYWIVTNKGRRVDIRLLINCPEEWEVLKKALLNAKTHYTGEETMFER